MDARARDAAATFTKACACSLGLSFARSRLRGICFAWAARWNRSHGQERGPLAIRFAEECRYQPAEVTWLSMLP